MGKGKGKKINEARKDAEIKTEPEDEGQPPPPKKMKEKRAKAKTEQLADRSNTGKRSETSSNVAESRSLAPSLSINTFPKAALVVQPVPSTSAAAAAASISKATVKGPAPVVEMASICVPAMTKAMGNSVILRKIFEHVSSVMELKRYRRVSRFWRDESLPSWRKSGKLLVYIRGRLNRPESLIKAVTGGCVALEDLVSNDGDYFYKMREYPFQSYKIIEAVNFPLSLDPENAEELRFWEEIGPLMKYLQFDAAVFRSGRVLEGLQTLLLTYCPNLQELNMNPLVRSLHRAPPNWRNVTPGPLFWAIRVIRRIRNFDSTEEERESQRENCQLKSWTIQGGELQIGERICFSAFQIHRTLAKKILRMLPSLQNLALLEKGFDYINSDFINALNNPTTSDRFANLRKLEIREKLSTEDLQRLHNYMQIVGPPLESLKIKISTADAKKEPAPFGAIMKLAVDTLKSLDLEVYLRFRPWFPMTTLPFFDALNGCYFRKMSALRIGMEYCNVLGTARDFTPLDFQCLWGMPSLKTFSYSEKGRSVLVPPKTDVLSPKDLKDDPPPPLQNLEDFYYWSEFSDECSQLLRKWIPNFSEPFPRTDVMPKRNLRPRDGKKEKMN